MTLTASRPTADTGTSSHLIRFPRESSEQLQQSEAYFFIEEKGQARKLRFHDYDEIYARPGLYEQIFHDRLQCSSPHVVVDHLASAVRSAGERMESLRVLDLGAGNGLVGEELKRKNVSRLVGIDIIAEAREAALRDRPQVYDDYLVADVAALDPNEKDLLADWRFDALVTVAALGFGDIPREAFFEAVNFVDANGWLAFNIKTSFLGSEDQTGFSRMVKAMLTEDLVEIHHLQRYVHRLSIDGDPLQYLSVVVRKKGDLPSSLLD